VYKHRTCATMARALRPRVTPARVQKKYRALARDASSSGDRVQAENYLQHAEHYFRIINQIQESENRQRGNAGAAGLGPQPSLGGSAEDEDGGEMGDESEAAADERAPMSA
ncbi:DUF4167 domain-containing protein, partial [Azospirillum formosense]|uniref:DUF4167 domain-containing protein n=1 Tax=Azospirillum formosense TaxID=861533 RepID=UPI001FFFD993